MRSSTGQHFIALDHVRAFAAYLVFVWHFTHGRAGVPIPFEGAPRVFPLAILDEGHTGVALFMTLSGYLFAKLLDGKAVDYVAFLRNRALRLLPLLLIVIAVVGLLHGMRGENLADYAREVAQGIYRPTLPNGGWSITIEFHFYLILPALLWLQRRSPLLPMLLVLAAIGMRSWLYQRHGEIQSLAYFTLVGRIDQFTLGIVAYQLRRFIAGRHLLAGGLALLFTAFYWYFDQRGGFYLLPAYPSPSRLWILLPTIEAVAFAVAIAWYDNSFRHSTARWSRFVGRLGAYSYSIYLLHFFVVFEAADFIHRHVMDLSNFYLAVAWATACFALMIVPASLSFRFIESPFLKLRSRYLRAVETG